VFKSTPSAPNLASKNHYIVLVGCAASPALMVVVFHSLRDVLVGRSLQQTIITVISRSTSFFCSRVSWSLMHTTIVGARCPNGSSTNVVS